MDNWTKRNILGIAASVGTSALLGKLPAYAAAQPSAAPTTALDVITLGSGQRVVFVHGSNSDGPTTWSHQWAMADRWQLEIVNRRGYGKSPPPAVRQDFEEDAKDIAALLGDGAHLVSHSYGAIGSLYAAALRPEAVRSLTVNEPPAFGYVKGDPQADALAARMEELRLEFPEPRAFYEAFIKNVVGPGASGSPLPDPLPPALERGVRMGMAARNPAEAKLPIEALKHTSFPKLVISGGHHPVFETICDKLSSELTAERAIIRGSGHNVPRTGAPFNDRLQMFLNKA
jgi:pimeloyl-ACP methyl ester carboxylesterase